MTDSSSPTNSAILICGHGSRDPAAIEEFLRVVQALAKQLPDQNIEHGFLEINEPSLGQSLENLYKQGVRRITVLPAMLFAAAHVRNDIPAILSGFQTSHPETEITFGKELGASSIMTDAATTRIETAMQTANQARPVKVDDTALLVVARGSRDEDALAKLDEIVAILKDKTGIRSARACYASIARPLMKDLLQDCGEQGAQRIIYLPWLLFTGVLIQRLNDELAQAAAAWPGTEMISIDYFADHPAVIGTFVERHRETRKHG